MAEFGDIRGLLHAPVTRAARQDAWELLLKALQKEYRKRPDEVTEEWLPYVMQMLDRDWPDEARVAPRDWVNALKRGEDKGALMALVRAVDVARMTNPNLQQLFDADGFEWVTHLTFGGYRLKVATLQKLSRSSSFANVRSLTFFQTPIGAGRMRSLNKNSYIDRLTELRLPYCELTDSAMDIVLKNDLEHLRVLDLRHFSGYWGAMFGRGSWLTLAEHEMPSLRNLDMSGWTDLGDVTALLRAPWVERLERLRVSPMWIDDWQRDPRAQRIHATEMNGLLEVLHDSQLPEDVCEDTIRALSEENPREL